LFAKEFAKRAHTQHNIAVGRYVIMPDHLHRFVRGPDDFQLGQWIGMLKQHLAKAIESSETSRPLWQRGFHLGVCVADERRTAKRPGPVKSPAAVNCSLVCALEALL
jgi:REP element-mobilizing transposase RayT